MKITIIYDNTAWDKNLTPDWGFSCLVEAYDRKILFDTGAKGEILLNNMKKLDIDPSEIDMVFISHDHRDHTGGLGVLWAEDLSPQSLVQALQEEAEVKNFHKGRKHIGF